jgi:hypothetical protein
MQATDILRFTEYQQTLIELDLSHCLHISGLSLTAICHNLSKLNMERCHDITNISVAEIQNVTKLVDLNILWVVWEQPTISYCLRLYLTALSLYEITVCCITESLPGFIYRHICLRCLAARSVVAMSESDTM